MRCCFTQHDFKPTAFPFPIYKEGTERPSYSRGSQQAGLVDQQRPEVHGASAQPLDASLSMLPLTSAKTSDGKLDPDW